MSHKKPLTIFSSEGFGASNSDILAKYIVVSRETRIKTAYVMKYIYSIVLFTNEFLIICAYVYYQLLLIFQIKLSLILLPYLILFSSFSCYLFVRYPIGQVEIIVL